jgi:hypothetical protein
MDTLARRFTELDGATDAALYRLSQDGPRLLPGFGSRGFKSRFYDPDPVSGNQARHTIFGLIVGFTGAGALARNLTGDFRNPLQVANEREDPNTVSGRADIALNNITVPRGESSTVRDRNCVPEVLRNGYETQSAIRIRLRSLILNFHHGRPSA